MIGVGFGHYFHFRAGMATCRVHESLYIGEKKKGGDVYIYMVITICVHHILFRGRTGSSVAQNPLGTNVGVSCGVRIASVASPPIGTPKFARPSSFESGSEK